MRRPVIYDIYTSRPLRRHSNLYRPRTILRAATEDDMLDLAMIALGIGFFAVSVLYVRACNRM